jgi:hypothetical protein
MISIRSLVENLNLFERSKIPPGKILGKNTRTSIPHTTPKPKKTAKPLSEIHKISKTAI